MLNFQVKPEINFAQLQIAGECALDIEMDVHPKYLTRIHRKDGYAYQTIRADNQMALAVSGGHHPA